MSPEQYERVRSAVLAFVAKGGKLRRGAWGVAFANGLLFGDEGDPHSAWVLAPGSCACALGAFVFETQPKPKRAPNGEAMPCETIAEVLGTRSSLVMSFACGFDGTAPYRGHESAPEEMRAWYLAGVRMREELGTPNVKPKRVEF